MVSEALLIVNGAGNVVSNSLWASTSASKLFESRPTNDSASLAL